MSRIALSFALLTVIGLLFSCSGRGKKTAEYITFDASTLRNVTRITDDGMRKGKLSVSKDGSKILYSESKLITGKRFQKDYTIMMIRNLNSTAKTTLVTDPSYGPAWFENGSEYLYSAIEQGKTKIVKSNIAGGGKTYITRNPVGEWDSDPTIKGNTILFSTLMETRTGKKWHLVSMNDKGGEVTILGEGMDPSWHPYKNKFVFAKNDGGIYEMDIQDNQITQLFSIPKDDKRLSKERCINPSYSQDGNWILFAKGANENIFYETSSTDILSGGGNWPERRWHLFAMKEDGSDFSQLTSGNVDVFHPTWGVGNEIFFVSNVAGKEEIWRASLAMVRPASAPLPVAPVAPPAPAPYVAPVKKDEGLL
ncbi:MAG: hypothetical protein FWC26_07910 [Fibromonadales bacterium]|nr:hypothetical protein [Fibromonadales bacterium]